jgi:hypothetical protein
MRCGINSKLVQESVNNEEEKIRAIKTVLAKNIKADSSINDEINLLLKDKPMNDLNQKIAEIWNFQAKLSQKLSQLNYLIAKDHQGIVKEIDALTDTLKRQCTLSCNIIEEERKKLIVVQEVFKKKIGSRTYTKSFKEKSFKMALEELLDEKSNIASKRQAIQEMPDEEEKNYTKFYSALELEKELAEVQKSFIVPDKKSKKANCDLDKSNGRDFKPGDQILPANLLAQPDTSVRPLHPLIKKLIDSNPVYQEFPIKNTPTNFRTQLPILRDPNVKINIWAILKENIGKDLSKIAMPVYMNEPLSMLQKTAEFLAYQHLYRKANNCESEYLRIAYVTGVIFILLSNVVFRMKKPFNPLLGETYEYVDGDLKCVIEQVSHHPPICAYYCDSNDFIVEGALLIKSKLSLSGFEFYPSGEYLVTLKKTGELFSIKRPFNSIHNYIIGKMYIWVNGTLECTNHKTGTKMVVNFKPKGWTAKNDYEVDGTITTKEGKEVYSVYGKWNSFLNVTDLSTKKETEIVTREPNPENFELQYYFGKFSINLNNLTQDMVAKIAPTDVRLRPDQRAYEHGNLDLATIEKDRLEKNQRKKRKLSNDGHEIFDPKWFHFEMNGDEIKAKYKQESGYFVCRESGNWPHDLRDLYNE